MLQQTDRDFQRTYPLAEMRQQPKDPAPHQHQALTKLQQWFKEQSKYKQSGGILVLPTGGGKTLTAHRFLCTNPLPNGYKVLWLAHTHHLLEQAFYDLESELKLIHETNNNKKELKVRVVSGTKGHSRPCEIEPNDDFLICTLQTVTRALQNKLTQLEAFLKAAGNKLFVIFDEAHHSPAPSYYKFITELRKNHPGMCLLGLTATPLYTDKKKSGRLGELFPQDILYQVSATQLMADGILAEPEFKSAPTKFTPEFDENKYKQWVRDYQDLPEEIITKLAENRDRNSFIAKTYAQNKDFYGKTIIFADRWFQCEQLREFLEQQKKGIKVGTVYSHIDADPGNADARNKRTQDENSKVLEAFRKNELDVLINVRMLTEGTDVPNVNTVFLTRQTTSKILLTQMVGRALRGPRFGGTEKAYIVSFIDEWQQAINWAQYDPLDNRPTLPDEQKQLQTRAMKLISIDLVRRLISQMDSGNNINPVPFSTFMPIGWYRVEFKNLIAGGDDSEPVQLLIMVFENERTNYQKFIEHLSRENLDEFLDPNLNLESKLQLLEEWQMRFFSADEHIGEDLLKNLFYMARHIAENGKETLDWFDFEKRKEHDLDKIAQDFIDKDFGPLTVGSKLQEEYDRRERYWQIIYSDFIWFKSHYDACVNRILFPPPPPPPPLPPSPPLPDAEPSDAVKKEVKERDNYRCLCCGEDNRKVLVIDHIIPRYHGGTHSLDNLQTLCRKCNNLKNIDTIDFRKYQPPSKEPKSTFPQMEKLIKEAGDNIKEWKQLLRRNINFFYECSSVKLIVKRKCTSKPTLSICFEDGIDRTWVKPHIRELTQKASSIREWEIFIK